MIRDHHAHDVRVLLTVNLLWNVLHSPGGSRVGIAAGRIERTRIAGEGGGGEGPARDADEARATRDSRSIPTVQVESKTVRFVRHGHSAANAACEEERAGPGTPPWIPHPESATGRCVHDPLMLAVTRDKRDACGGFPRHMHWEHRVQEL